MINFIACIDFKGLKGKNIYFESKYHDQTKQGFTQSYNNDYVLFRHNGSDENLDLFTKKDGKFLVFTKIFEEDKITLIKKLGINENVNIKDSELMLELYFKFGAAGMKCLSNGFIFILIDLIKENVMAFRDHIGIKNICYLHSGNSIYLSSSFRNLFNVNNKNFSLNLDKMDNFLNFKDSSNTNTFINEINKVPPSHFIEYHQDQIKVIQYSEYRLEDNLATANDQINGLKHLLKKSVYIDKSCKYSKIGFTMSGGIDSSTVISFFREFKDSAHKIFSFSAQYKHLDKKILNLIDESEYQNEINKSTDIYDTSFDGQDESTLSKLDFYLEVIGQPFFFPNLYLPNKAFSLASEKDVYLMMNGNDGDTVVSHGYEYFQELFYNLRWIKLLKEIDVTSRLRKQSRRFIFKRIILNSFSLSNFFNFSAKKKHLDVICSSNHTKAIEIQGLLASYYGIEERYPFYNRELIEYCLNVTPDLKNKHGQARYILKEAIKGIVPEKIRKRVTKANLGHALCLSFVVKDNELINAQLSKPNPAIRELIDLEDLRSSWENMKVDPRKYATNSLVPSRIFAYVVLNRWLDSLPLKLKKLENKTQNVYLHPYE
tara:strand:+ start:723 stop:2525 length:1803 start_codon:yes stop_codon:yes gene_type:complete